VRSFANTSHRSLAQKIQITRTFYPENNRQNCTIFQRMLENYVTSTSSLLANALTRLAHARYSAIDRSQRHWRFSNESSEGFRPFRTCMNLASNSSFANVTPLGLCSFASCIATNIWSPGTYSEYKPNFYTRIPVFTK